MILNSAASERLVKEAKLTPQGRILGFVHRQHLPFGEYHTALAPFEQFTKRALKKAPAACPQSETTPPAPRSLYEETSLACWGLVSG